MSVLSTFYSASALNGRERARPELVIWNGTPSPLEIFTSSPHRKDSSSLATPKVSNEMGGMQALKEAEAARD